MTAVSTITGRVAETDWPRPTPQCPGWAAAALVGHPGAILSCIGKIVATGERGCWWIG